ncbi:MAG: hypothetical protein ABFC67_04755 [Mizugakiibacter sp.]|uniref:hypothetical protein n=1 Tax=Mizugakiibacter sp. TaxID=1972610 RepID=UPI00320F249F
MCELVTRAGQPAANSAARKRFAKQVHAEAHAIVALVRIKRRLELCTSPAEVAAVIQSDIVERCRALDLDPDLMSDALEAARFAARSTVEAGHA